eukprot:g7890.t1
MFFFLFYANTQQGRARIPESVDPALIKPGSRSRLIRLLYRESSRLLVIRRSCFEARVRSNVKRPGGRAANIIARVDLLNFKTWYVTEGVIFNGQWPASVRNGYR